MDIPPEYVIKSTIKTGSVYYFNEESFESDHGHFFVILNENPLLDGDLIMVHATSKVEKRQYWVNKRGFPQETLVEVNPLDCDFISKPSIFDCNVVTHHTLTVLIDKKASGELKLIGQIDATLANKLINGVLASPVVENKIKKVIRRNSGS